MAVLALLLNTALFAEDFYLDGPYNTATLRVEIDNDIVWDSDSNFSNGWSIQYHTICYDSWEDADVPIFVKWVGNHFPGLNDNDSIVRNGHGFGQNMITSGDITLETPQEGDLPYAGSLTYSLSWQSFNRKSVRNLQLTAGILGKEALAGDIQKFIHNDLFMGDDPRGWSTQRKTEPVFNIGYQYGYRMVQLGTYTNDWGGQIDIGSRVSLGNIDTSAEVAVAFQFGWNVREGFETLPSPPGVGIFQASHIPKPAFASPHSVELLLGVSGKGVLYSSVYDGSLITSDDRDVEREVFLASGLFGLNYHYHKRFSVSVQFQATTDLIKDETIPEPPPGKEKTRGDLSFGALIVDVYF